MPKPHRHNHLSAFWLQLPFLHDPITLAAELGRLVNAALEFLGTFDNVLVECNLEVF